MIKISKYLINNPDKINKNNSVFYTIKVNKLFVNHKLEQTEQTNILKTNEDLVSLDISRENSYKQVCFTDDVIDETNNDYKETIGIDIESLNMLKK